MSDLGFFGIADRDDSETILMTSLREIELRVGEEAAFAIFRFHLRKLRDDPSSQSYDVTGQLRNLLRKYSRAGWRGRRDGESRGYSESVRGRAAQQACLRNLRRSGEGRLTVSARRA